MANPTNAGSALPTLKYICCPEEENPMAYTEDPGYEPALHRDLEPIEQRCSDLEQAIRELTLEVAHLKRQLSSLEVALKHHERIDH